jgi:hypothetical protein
VAKNEFWSAERLLDDPRSRKWIAQCAACLRIGYRADAKAQFFNRHWLTRYYESLDLAGGGRCQHCRASEDQMQPQTIST